MRPTEITSKCIYRLTLFSLKISETINQLFPHEKHILPYMLFFYVQSSAFIIEPSHTNNLKQTYDTPPCIS